MMGNISVPKRGLLPPPVGTSDWVTFSRDSYCVDKTLILKDLIDSKSRVVLFTRPRRFGKTTMLKMIRAFYEKVEKDGKTVDTSTLFTDKKIWAAGETYRVEQGKRQVIFLSFKDVKQRTWKETIERLGKLVCDEVERFRESVESSKWSAEDKRGRLKAVMTRTGTPDDLAESLGLLCEAVHVHCGEMPVVLIDEYDQPITTASTNGFYDEMCDFMRVFLSGALKDNEHCHLGIMTGVLRVAKEGILFGLNNPDVWTVFEPEYSQYFGFTKEEVAEMARYYGREDKLPEIRAWYDGYDFGGTEIFNPWSVVKYFKCGCRPDAYWLDTSSNDLITEIVQELPHDMVKTLEALLRGETVWVPMAKELGSYKDVRKNKSSLFSLLVSAGYLKVCSGIEKSGCFVSLPNYELGQAFTTDIQNKINNQLSVGTGDVACAIVTRDYPALKAAIAAFLVESVSYFDSATEGFFHGLTLGFLAVLRDEYVVLSNAESGEGRFDIALKPRFEQFPAFIIEVKHAKSETDDLKTLAATALRQIDDRDYAASFRAEGLADVEKIGLAYFKKKVEIQVGRSAGDAAFNRLRGELGS